MIVIKKKLRPTFLNFFLTDIIWHWHKNESRLGPQRSFNCEQFLADDDDTVIRAETLWTERKDFCSKKLIQMCFAVLFKAALFV